MVCNVMVWDGMVWDGMVWNGMECMNVFPLWLILPLWFFVKQIAIYWWKVEKIDVSGRDGAGHGWPDTTTMQKKVKPHERPGSTDEDNLVGFRGIQKLDGHPLVTWAIGWIFSASLSEGSPRWPWIKLPTFRFWMGFRLPHLIRIPWFLAPYTYRQAWMHALTWTLTLSSTLSLTVRLALTSAFPLHHIYIYITLQYTTFDYTTLYFALHFIALHYSLLLTVHCIHTLSYYTYTDTTHMITQTHVISLPDILAS